MNAAVDYKKILTEVLQKQIVILGPSITLAKARNVEGIEIDDQGNVKSLAADGHAISVKVLEQFRELSPRLVKKSMEPLLNAILYSQNPQEPQSSQILTAKPMQQDHSDGLIKNQQEHLPN